MSINSKQSQFFRIMDLGENYEKSQASLNSFKEQIMQCRQLIKSPQGFIKVYFSKLKTQVDTDREEARKAINAHYMLMSQELDMIQEDCLNSFNVNENKKRVNFERTLKEYEEKFLVLKNDLASVSKIDFKRWEEIMLDSNSFKVRLEAMKEDFEEELLMNKAVTYESSKLGMEMLEPVKLVTRQLKESIGDLQEFGSFHFTKTGFKEFSETKNAEFRSPFYIFNNIKWYAELENEDGENMGAYVYCIRQRESQEIMTLLGFQLNNKQNSSKNDFGQIEYKFTTENGHGYPEFISFEEIFQNGFYDEQNDSIDMTIFIQVKYIREYLKSESVTPRVTVLKPASPKTSAKLPLRKSAKTPGLKSARTREKTLVSIRLPTAPHEKKEQVSPKLVKSPKSQKSTTTTTPRSQKSPYETSRGQKSPYIGSSTQKSAPKPSIKRKSINKTDVGIRSDTETDISDENF